MIPRKELRIGNWVNCHFQTTNFNAQVLEVRHGGVLVQDGEYKNIYSYDNISPIQLTEWELRKAQFKEVNRKFFHDKLTPYIYKGKGFYGSEITPEIRCVHQLQNLFFALSGEELTIKNLTV